MSKWEVFLKVSEELRAWLTLGIGLVLGIHLPTPKYMKRKKETPDV